MIEFKNLELSDKAWIDACTAAEDSRSADFSFANMYPEGPVEQPDGDKDTKEP